MILKKTLQTLFFLLLCSGIFSQSENIRFRRITIDDGLSLSSVYAIYQDSKGFMWFGTEDGLNRYDGKNIRVFRSDISGKNSIVDKWIEHIAEDSTGLLWFGTRSGLSSFDPRKEIFYTFKKRFKDSTSLTNDSITTIWVDKYNNVWVGTKNGLNKINPLTLKNQQIGYDKSPVLTSRINSLNNGSEETTWIASNSGLFQYSNQKNTCHKIFLASTNRDTITRVTSVVEFENSLYIGSNLGLLEINLKNRKEPQNHLIGNLFNNGGVPIHAEQLHLSSENKMLWIAAQSGLYSFDLVSKKISWKVKAYNLTHSLSINSLKPIHEDNLGNIWYGTHGEGLFKIEQKTGIIYNYKNNPGDQSSLSENAINCIFEDNANALWLGTFGAGISIYNPQAHKFELVRNNPTNRNSLVSNFIWTILEDFKGDLWIGSNDRGITRYTPGKENHVFYDQNPFDPNSLSSSSVRELFQDSKGNIWIGTDGGGLNKFVPEENNFISYKHDRNDPHSISDNSVRVIYEDNYGVLWVGTRNGLNRFDLEKGNFKKFLHVADDTHSISNNFIYASILQDKKDNLWIGTYGGGLNIMDYKTGNFTSFQHNPENPNSISDNIVFTIYEEPDSEYFWIGTNNGLNRFNIKTKRFERFGLEEGLPNEVIYGILPNEDGNIWLSTNLGICQFNTKTFKTKNYDVNDGLQSNEFNGGAFHKGKSGKLYFGGVYGLNIIEPQNIKPDKVLSDIVITSLEVLGREVIVNGQTPEQDKGGNFIRPVQDHFSIPENISYTDEINLHYKNRFFSLEFAALGNINTGKVKYSYLMEGLDETWHYTGDRNYVSYADIRPGIYNFKVKAQNADGVWSAPSKGLKIFIKPPFWKTPWFYFLELIAVLGFAYFIYVHLMRIKTNKILTTQNQKISEVNQKLLESEKNLKELNATKDKFFSIIAHDLKNPFASLMSVGELLRNNYQHLDDEERHKGVEKIYDSVLNIHNLLENLLTWSRSQSKKIKFEPVEFNLSKLVEEVGLLYKHEAENKGIKLQTNFNENVLAFGDRDMINTVIRNLVNNAIKFCKKNDTVEVILEEKVNEKIVQVKDTGIGISQENQEKLFKIDRKFKTEGTSGEKGTGLGLILCREFIERNGGKISVESIPGEGSKFSISLPTKN